MWFLPWLYGWRHRRIESIKNVFSEMVTPNKTMRRYKEGTRKMGFLKKSIYFSLPFKGDITADIVRRHLSDSINKISHPAELQARFAPKSVLCLRLKESARLCSFSLCILIHPFLWKCVLATPLDICSNGSVNIIQLDWTWEKSKESPILLVYSLLNQTNRWTRPKYSARYTNSQLDIQRCLSVCSS